MILPPDVPRSAAPQTLAHANPSSTDEQRAVRLFAVLCIAAAGMAALLALLPAPGHDQLWFLLMARRWLAGATLYGPLAFDSNPPAIVWLSAVPVTLGRLLHVPATLPAKGLVMLLAAGCVQLSFPLLPAAWREPRRYERIALWFATTVLFYVVPARDFGQRDHLVSFLLLPYVLAAAARPQRPGLPLQGILAGLLAAVAICLKPHHALVPLVIEAALLCFPEKVRAPGPDFQTRGPAQPLDQGTPSVVAAVPPAGVESTDPSSQASGLRYLRAEPVVLLILGALYLFAIRHLAPLYVTQAVPLTRQVYAAIGHLTLPQLLWEAVELCLLAALAAWLFFRQRRSSPAVRLLLLAGSASFAAYLVQGTGWYYQQLPAIGFFGLALVLELLDLAAARPPRLPGWLPRAAAALALLALTLTAHFTGYPFTPDRAFAIDSPDPALFRNLPPAASVAILTTSVDEAMMPVARYNLTWAQRTNNLWLLPQILRSERPEGQPALHPLPERQLKRLDALQHRWMVEDLTRWQPQLVLIERCQDQAVRCQVLEDRHDDLLAWFRRDPAFATLWQRYVFTRTDGRFDAYSRR